MSNAMHVAKTGLNAVGEVELSLRAGEGIGALLRRGGYTCFLAATPEAADG